jgi:hypothetical protein
VSADRALRRRWRGLAGVLVALPLVAGCPARAATPAGPARRTASAAATPTTGETTCALVDGDRELWRARCTLAADAVRSADGVLDATLADDPAGRRLTGTFRGAAVDATTYVLTGALTAALPIDGRIVELVVDLPLPPDS